MSVLVASVMISITVAATAAALITSLLVPVKELAINRLRLWACYLLIGMMAGALHIVGVLWLRVFWDIGGLHSIKWQLAIGLIALGLSMLTWRIRLVRLMDFGRILEIARTMGSGLDEAARSVAVGKIGEVLRLSERRWPPANLAMRVNLETYAALHLQRANLWREAETLLKKTPAAHLGGGFKAAHAMGLGACRLYQGDLQGAKAWFAQVARPVDDETLETIYRGTDALILVLEGRSQEALSSVGNDEEPLSEPTDLERLHEHVRAHALADLGDGDRARSILRRMLRRHGIGALERVAIVNGPASPLAQAILRDRDQPYR